MKNGGNMKKETNLKIIKAVKVFFNFGYWLMWFALAAAAMSAILIPLTNEFKNDFGYLPANFYLHSDEIKIAEVSIGEAVHEAYIERASGEIMIKDAPLWVSYLNLLFAIVAVSISLYTTKMILKIISSIEENRFFVVENALIIRKIAVALSGYLIFLLVYSAGISLFLAESFESDLLVHTGFLGYNFDIEDIPLPLLLFVFAEIFRAGAELKEEADLTI